MNRLLFVEPVRRGHNQRGAALLIVLLLVATLAIIAIGMTRTLRLSTAKTLAGETLTQARWYAVSTEKVGVQIMNLQWLQEPERDTVNDQWAREPAIFPVDNGQIETRLSDQTNCFNINSLVTAGENGLEANEETAKEYRRLLGVLGFDDQARDALSDSVIDWLDSDGQNRPGGAEDPDYGRLDQPYRAANTLIADISELRAMYWYSPEVYKVLRPYLCAYPGTEAAALNVNMMTAERHVPVLYAMLDGLLTVDQTRQLIGTLPERGYTSIEEFWTNAGVEQDTIPQEVFARPKVWSSYVQLEANVKYDQARMTMHSLLKITDDGQARVVTRKFGTDE